MIDTTFIFTPRALAVSPDLTRQNLVGVQGFLPQTGDAIALPGTDIPFVVHGRHVDFSQPGSIRVTLVLDLIESPPKMTLVE